MRSITWLCVLVACAASPHPQGGGCPQGQEAPTDACPPAIGVDAVTCPALLDSSSLGWHTVTYDQKPAERADTAGAARELRFFGSGAVLHYGVGPTIGTLAPVVDGTATPTIDGHAAMPGSTSTVVATGLALSAHTMAIVCETPSCVIDFVEVTCP
jgi:hypothetical protein